jgi:hypothetical protein
MCITCHMRITNRTSDLTGRAKCKPVRFSGSSCSQVWCFWHRVVFSKMNPPLLFGPLPDSFIRFVAVIERRNRRLWPVELRNAVYCCPRLWLGDANRWSPSDGSALFPVSTQGGTEAGHYLLWLACLCSTLLKRRDPTVMWTTTVFFHISPKLCHSECTCHTPLLHRPWNWFFFLRRRAPMRAMAFSFMRFLDHTQRRTTVGRTFLDEWSARLRDLSTW